MDLSSEIVSSGPDLFLNFVPKKCPPDFSQVCAEAGGKSLCGKGFGQMFCSKPLVGTRCFMNVGKKMELVGEKCLPEEETCQPGDKFDVGPYMCTCGPLGLIA